VFEIGSIAGLQYKRSHKNNSLIYFSGDRLTCKDSIDNLVPFLCTKGISP